MFKNFRNKFFESISSEQQVSFFKFANKVAETINLVITNNRDNEQFIAKFNRSLDSRIGDISKSAEEVECLKYMKETFNMNRAFDVGSMLYHLRHYSQETVRAVIQSVISCCNGGCSMLDLDEKELTQLNAGILALREYISKVEKDPLNGANQPCTVLVGNGTEFTFQNGEEACAAIREVVNALNIANMPQ
ncbi:hypothetical protein [Legionella sainthelensi]|uniref:Uncharacterized protein n=1 Tax=Legionella sainthelensi TaxID=28087 RepID=A0A2H5FKZ0_9GAMM|nr:hypothetical protein [Legionella sainthelensi]AUH72208.1 hypothetical protein CAB17_09150 [Legionella sainthelensi]